MTILLLQESWWSGINAVWGLLLILLMIGGAILILLSRKREEVTLIESKRADANANLLKTRESELDICNKKCEKCEIELEDVTVEYRSLAGVKIAELIQHWEAKLEIEAEVSRLKRDNKRLQLQLGLEEKEK